MKIAFFKGTGHGIRDWINTMLIRLWTFGVYSHVELIDDHNSENPDDWDWYSSSAFSEGKVRMKKIKYNPYNWDVYDIHQTYLFDTDIVFGFIRSQFGKDYDWKGIYFSQIFPFKKQDQDKWFCSEIVHRALCDGLLFFCPAKYYNSAEFSPNRLFRFMKNNDFLVNIKMEKLTWQT